MAKASGVQVKPVATGDIVIGTIFGTVAGILVIWFGIAPMLMFLLQDLPKAVERINSGIVTTQTIHTTERYYIPAAGGAVEKGDSTTYTWTTTDDIRGRVPVTATITEGK